MDTASVLCPTPSDRGDRIGSLGTFASPSLENAYQEQHFRDDLWLSRLVVPAGMLRVAALLVVDYQHFGVGPEFWPLLACRILFLAASVGVLVALRRVSSPTALHRLFLGWAYLIGALTVYAISARLPYNNELLLMSFVTILMVYLVTPLSLVHQGLIALAFSAAVLCIVPQANRASLSTVAVAYTLSNVFGAYVSWRLNHRRRQAFLGFLREVELRAKLEKAAAEIKTLQGMLCMCAWCKRVRDEVETWQTVETFVKTRTRAAFTHGICPDCLQSQVDESGRVMAGTTAFG